MSTAFGFRVIGNSKLTTDVQFTYFAMNVRFILKFSILIRLYRKEGDEKKREGEKRAEKNSPPNQNRKKRALLKEKKRRAERGREQKNRKNP